MKKYLYKCKFKGCEVEQPILSKGFCNYHRHQQRMQEGTLPVYKNKIKRSTVKNQIKRKAERNCLKGFFKRHISILEKNPYSTESKKLITTPLLMSIAHILPKRKNGGFPDLQCNDENVIYLTWQEHTRFDELLDRRDFSSLEKEFPNSWGKVTKKIKSLLEVTKIRNKMYLSLTAYLEV